MSSNSLQPPLAPRDGRVLRILLPSRVSDLRPGKQSEQSLDDQQDIQRRWLNERTELPVEETVIAGSGSGENLSRQEYLQLLALIESRQFDLVLVEDLGRIVRRAHAFFVCELCEDHGTRLIAINNYGVDTALENWRDAAFFAAYCYERENADKSRRIKERLRARFLAGGALPDEIYGYIRPVGAKHDSEMSRDPDAEAIYKEWFRMLDEDDASFADVARWLNKKGIATSPHSSETEWDGRLVGRHTYNTILKGQRRHNDRKTKRLNNPGKYISIKAEPSDLLVREVPHLAFFSEAYYDRVVAKVMRRNAPYCSVNPDKPDPRKGKPKKATRCPGQMCYCGICGRLFVWGGNGQTDRLMCNGAREHRCWNGITFDGVLAAHLLSEAVLGAIDEMEDFDPTAIDRLQDDAKQADVKRLEQIQDIGKRIEVIEGKIDNAEKAILDGYDGQRLPMALQNLEYEHATLLAELDKLNALSANVPLLPTTEKLKSRARRMFDGIPVGTYEFGQKLKVVVPRIVVFPYRYCAGNSLVLRAKFRIQLANLVSDPRQRSAMMESLESKVTLDLFDSPQPVVFRERIMAARASMTEKQAADQYGITVTAAQYAARLHRKMERLRLNDAYVPLFAPPDDIHKFCRHKHIAFRFEPLPDAGEW